MKPKLTSNVWLKFKDEMDHIQFITRVFRDLLIKKKLITEKEYEKMLISLAKKDKRKFKIKNIKTKRLKNAVK